MARRETLSHRCWDDERCATGGNDAGGTLARYTTESGSYYEPMWHMQRWTGESRFPLYDGIGSVRGLVNQMGTVTDTYEMDAFGVAIGGAGATENPYRLGGAWGYLTDPSGMLQLGARFYWPEVGRFVQQDPLRDGMNWYAYAGSRPTVAIDPEGEKWYKPWTWRRRRPCPGQEPCPGRQTGLALAAGGVAAIAVGDAAGKSGEAWAAAGAWAKGIGLGAAIVGGIITFVEVKPEAVDAGHKVQDTILNPSGTGERNTPWTPEEVEELRGIYPGIGRRHRHE